MYRTRMTERYRHALPGSSFYACIAEDEGQQFHAVPSGWCHDRLGPWVRVYRHSELQRLPRHGWKIHISSTPHQEDEILGIVGVVCAESDTPFKHLRSVREYFLANRKYADRQSGGKFITVYPRNPESFVGLLRQLDGKPSSFDGPYILTDARYGSGPVFFRYGAFFYLAMGAMEERPV